MGKVPMWVVIYTVAIGVIAIVTRAAVEVGDIVGGIVGGIVTEDTTTLILGLRVGVRS